MRRFPSSWKETRAALGFREPVQRAKKQRKRGRRSRCEPLEGRHLLTATLSRPAYEFVVQQQDDAYDPAEQFMLTTEYDVGTDQPRAVLTVRDDLTEATLDVGLQQIELALRLGNHVLESQSILIDIAEEEFVRRFNSDRLDAASEVLEGAAATPVEPIVVPTMPLAELLDVEAFLAGRRTGTLGEPAAAAFYDSFRFALSEAAVTRDYPPGPDEYAEAVERIEQLGSAGTLLTGQLRVDAGSLHGPLSGAATAATEALGEHGGSFYTIFSGTGGTQELAREEGFGGAQVFVLAIVEEPTYVAADSLRIELGEHAAMVQAFLAGPAGSGPSSAALMAQVGVVTRDTFVASTQPGTPNGTDQEMLSLRSGASESHGVFSIDLASVDGLVPDAASITLDATAVIGVTDQRIEAHYDYWSGSNLWDESALEWNAYEATLAAGFRSWDTGSTSVAAAGGVTFDVTEAVQRALLGGDADANGTLDAFPSTTRGDLEALYLAVRDPARYAEVYEAALQQIDTEPDGGADLLYRNDLNWDGVVDSLDLYRAGKRLDALGDFNLDGVVDGADYSVWQANYGIAANRFGDGDGNADGLVNAVDYNFWRDGEDQADSADPYEGIAAQPELTFRVVTAGEGAQGEGLVVYDAPTLAGTTIDTTATPRLQATDFTSPVGSTGWQIGYEVLHEATGPIVVEVYQTPVIEGVRGQGVLAYESTPITAGVGAGTHTVSAADILLPLPGIEHVLEARVRSLDGSVSAGRDFSHGLFYDGLDALHAYGADGEDTLMVSGSFAFLSVNAGAHTPLDWIDFGVGTPQPTAVHAYLGSGSDTLFADLGLNVPWVLNGGHGDDAYWLTNAPTSEVSVEITDASGFDTLTGQSWAPLAAGATLDLGSTAPQTLAFADRPDTLTLQFATGDEIQYADLPASLELVGRGYGSGVLTVDSLSDRFDGHYGEGGFALREAIDLANRIDGPHTIRFDDDLFQVGPGTIAVGDDPRLSGAANELLVEGELRIEGPGSHLLTIDAQHASRLFQVAVGADLTIADLTGTGGRAAGAEDGGAIWARGELTLDRTVWHDNGVEGRAHYLGGHGGVVAGGSEDLTIRDSVLRNNYGKWGAAVHFRPDGGEHLLIERSSLVENEARHVSGGGLGSAIAVYSYSANAGSVSLVNTTISNNLGLNGGAVWIVGSAGNSQLSVDILNSTIVQNRATNRFWTAGIFDQTNGVVELRNSILAENEDGHGDDRDARANMLVEHSVVGFVDRFDVGDQDNNPHTRYLEYLIDDPATGVIVLDGPETVGLRPLGDYGGATLSHTLLPNSLAINAGDNEFVGTPPAAYLAGPIFSDQRAGAHQRIVAGTIDLGAIEAHVLQIGVEAYSIYGTPEPDAISVGPEGFTFDRLPGERLDFDPSGLASLTVESLDGDDIVSVSNAFTFDTTIDGGDGDDLLLGGGGEDLLFGGDGADTLRGREGADTLYGGSGADLLHGGDDYTGDDGLDWSDAVFGGADYDRSSDNPSTETVDLGSGQNNSLSNDDTPVSTFFGSPVWNFSNPDSPPLQVPDGETIVLRHDVFSSDRNGELQIRVVDADGLPVP